MSIENDVQRTSNKRYYLPNVEIKDFNVTIHGKNFVIYQNVFDQLIKNNRATYENIRKIPAGQRDDHTTGCLLDYTYFREIYKMIAVDLNKQKAFYSDHKAIRQINFT